MRWTEDAEQNGSKLELRTNWKLNLGITNKLCSISVQFIAWHESKVMRSQWQPSDYRARRTARRSADSAAEQ